MKELIKKEKRILTEALKLFALLGYDQTSLEKIAYSASVGKGTVYLYFNSKLHLLLSVLVQGLMRLNQSLANLPGTPGGNGLERLASLVTTYFSFVRENSDFFKVFLKEQDRLLAEGAKVDVSQLIGLTETIRQKFVAEMRQLIQTGLLPERDPQWYAAVMNALIIHCALDRILGGEVAGTKDKGAMIVAAFLTEVKVLTLINNPPEKERKVLNRGT